MRDITDTVAAQFKALSAKRASGARKPASRIGAHTGADETITGQPRGHAPAGGYSLVVDAPAAVEISTAELEALMDLFDPGLGVEPGVAPWFGARRPAQVRLQPGEVLDDGRIWATPYGVATVLAGAGACPIRLVPDPHEAEIVARIFHLATAAGGGFSLRQMVVALLAAGIVGRGGVPLNKSRIETMLNARSYAYAGEIKMRRQGARRGTRLALAAPAVIPPELFEEASQARAQRRATHTAPRLTTGPTLLLGLARCGCSGAIEMRTAQSGRSRRLVCTGSGQTESGKACGLTHPMARIEQQIVDAVAAAVLPRDRVAEIVAVLNARRTETVARLRERLRQSLGSEGRVREERDYVLRFFEAGDRMRPGTLHRLSFLEEAVHEAWERIRIYQTALADQRTGKGRYDATSFADLVRSQLDAVTPEARKRWLRLFVHEIILEPERITIRLKTAPGQRFGGTDDARGREAVSRQSADAEIYARSASVAPGNAIRTALPMTLQDNRIALRGALFPDPAYAPNETDRSASKMAQDDELCREVVGTEPVRANRGALALIVSLQDAPADTSRSSPPVVTSQRPQQPRPDDGEHHRRAGAYTNMPPSPCVPSPGPGPVSISMVKGGVRISGNVTGSFQTGGISGLSVIVVSPRCLMGIGP